MDKNGNKVNEDSFQKIKSLKIKSLIETFNNKFDNN